MEKISKREELFKKDVKNIARQYNEEVRIKMTGELQEKILVRNELEEKNIEKSLPSDLPWNDKRGIKEKDSKQYENSYIGELEQIIDETKDIKKRKELIDELRNIKTTEKNNKIAELDKDIATREEEMHQKEKYYLNECFNSRKSVEDEIMSEIDIKKVELEKVQESKKKIKEEMAQAKKIREQVEKNSRIYKAANDEVKDKMKNFKQEYINIKSLKSEIKSLEEELKDFRDKYANIDLENEIYGINILVARTMGLKEDQEIFNSIMDYEDELDKKDDETKPVESRTNKGELQTPEVITPPQSTEPPQTKKTKQLPVKEQQTITQPKKQSAYSILIGRNAEITIENIIVNVGKKTVKEGINLTNEQIKEILKEHITFITEWEPATEKLLNDNILDPVVINVIDKSGLTKEQKSKMITNYLQDCFSAVVNNQKTNGKVIYNQKDLSKTSIIDRILRREVNENEKFQIQGKALASSRYGISEAQGEYKPGIKSILLGKLFGKPVKAYLTTSELQEVATTYNKYRDDGQLDKLKNKKEKVKLKNEIGGRKTSELIKLAKAQQSQEKTQRTLLIEKLHYEMTPKQKQEVNNKIKSIESSNEEKEPSKGQERGE